MSSEVITKDSLMAILNEVLPPIDSFVVDIVSTSSFNIAANNVAETTISVAKTGYTPLGIMGYNITGSGVSFCFPYHLYLDGNTAYYAFRNRNTSQATGVILYINVLYMKTSN